MNKKLLLTAATAALCFLGFRAIAADAKPADKSDAKSETKKSAKSELQELVSKVQNKIQQDKGNEKDLADELKQFDALLEKHKDEKTDEVASIAFMKAMLYLQVFEDLGKAKELFGELGKNFEKTEPGKRAGDILKQIEQQEKSKKIQETLVAGNKFPDFDEKDLAGKPLSIASYKGKVVLVDFWATWCGPCVRELPNVLKAYETYHNKGFEIVGVSLDEDKDALTDFIKKHKMTWPQFFDGQGWKNKLAAQYGIQAIPATFLIDGEGKIIGRDLRGDALAKAVGEALEKK